jgi:tyrosyl-tRNA synthetase
MKSVFDELQQRGFVEQVSDEAALRQLLENKKITCYIGFDPTADSLHVGSLVPIMALAHMQRWGHKPIAILGGGTTMVGDPSGKTEMRQMLTREQIVANGQKIKEQLSGFLDFDNGLAMMIDNADWLLNLNYIDFLRDIGKHFSVNRMLAAEAYKIRLEAGLSFIEFNYQVLQAYDYLMLYRRHGCVLQMGGNDQWGNILAGVDLIRRIEGVEAQALTFPLITTAGGAKMGKTAKGAVWLDAQRTSPYEFYQFWINTDDRDVGRFIKFFTFLPMKEIVELEKLQGADLREAKQVLAFEVTKIVHGETESTQARNASLAMFGGGGQTENIPSSEWAIQDVQAGISVVDLFVKSGLVSSKSDARRLIEQGGAYVNQRRIESHEEKIDMIDVNDGGLILRAGKKRYHRVIVQ